MRPSSSKKDEHAAPRLLACDAFNRAVDQSDLNADVFERLEFLNRAMRHADNRLYVVACTGEGKIIAAATLMPSLHVPGALAIAQISVDPQHKNNGHGRRLLATIFDYAAARNTPLRATTFEPEGWRYLAPVMARLHRQYPNLRIFYADCDPYCLTGEHSYKLVEHGLGGLKALLIP